MVRDDLLGADRAGRIVENSFLHFYRVGSASAQVDLLDLAWALSHPLPLLVADRLLAPARRDGSLRVPLEAVDALVHTELHTVSIASLRKTRTVVLGALERIGAIRASGTGRNRVLWADTGHPHPLAFGWMTSTAVRAAGGALAMGRAVTETAAARLTGCTVAHALACVAWCVERGVLLQRGEDLLPCESFGPARGPASGPVLSLAT